MKNLRKKRIKRSRKQLWMSGNNFYSKNNNIRRKFKVMPKGIYKHKSLSEETKQKMRKFKSEITKERMS